MRKATKHIDEIAALWNSGKTISEISKELAFPVETVRWIKKTNAELFNARKKVLKTEKSKPESKVNKRLWSVKDQTIAAEMWKNDATYRQIGLVIGKTRTTVGAYMLWHRDLFPKKGKTSLFFKGGDVLNREKPTPENTTIQYDFKEIPMPDDALGIPFVDLQTGQCSWIMETFWQESSMTSPCCGKSVMNLRVKGMQQSYCDFHYNAALEKK